MPSTFLGGGDAQPIPALSHPVQQRSTQSQGLCKGSRAEGEPSCQPGCSCSPGMSFHNALIYSLIDPS